MELEESLKQIDKLEQFNRSQLNSSFTPVDDLNSLEPTNLQESVKSLAQAKQKHTALKLGVPSLDFTQLKQVKEYKDWYGYS